MLSIPFTTNGRSPLAIRSGSGADTGAPAALDQQSGIAARWGLAAVYAMLAYEWLLAGLNKDLSGTFRSGLANRLRGSFVDNPNGWYVSFVKWAVLPHVQVFAILVEIGELLVAAGLIWGALLWLRPAWFSASIRRWLGIGVTVALLGSAVMELNYYLLAGQGWPWLRTSDPFIEGLSVDGLMMLISLALIPGQLRAARHSSNDREAMTDRTPAAHSAERVERSNQHAIGEGPAD